MLRAKLGKVDMAGQTRAREENPMAKISQAAYQTGYGDFCFGRLADRVMVGYANPVFAEFMTDYKHTKDARLQTISGPLYFLKLPLEIRYMIYRQIFGSLYLEDMKTLYFRVLPTRENPNLWRFRGNYAWYLKTQQQRLQPQQPPTNTGAASFSSIINFNPYAFQLVYIMTPQEYMAEKRRLSTKNETHPSRGASYRLEIVPRSQGFTIVKDNRSDLYVEWIRQLSNVCATMRKEIGDVLWMQTMMSSSDGAGIWLLRNMLEERPLIHKSIKSLDLKLELDKPQTLFGQLRDFEHWCKYIAEHLELNSLTFTLDLMERDLRLVTASPGGTFSLLGACSDIPVKKEFDVHMQITKWSPGAPFFNERDMDRRRAQRKKKYLPLFKELMRPKCLKDVDTVMVDAPSS